MAAKEAKPRPLAVFYRDQRRANCAVCRLPIEVRADLKTAREKKIPRTVVLEWLNTEHKAKITGEQIQAHTNGHHDDT